MPRSIFLILIVSFEALFSALLLPSVGPDRLAGAGALRWAARVGAGQELQAVGGMCGEKVWGWESAGQQTVVMGAGTLL